MRKIKNLLGGLLLVIIFTHFDKSFHKEKPVQDKNKLFWAWGCLLALALLGLMNKCVNAQVPVFYAGLQYPILGQTVCDKAGNIAILVNSNFNFDSTALRRVLEHENFHVGQIRSIGSCEEAGKIYAKDPMAQELPAYCAELKERMVAGDAGEVLSKFVLHMFQTYAKGRSINYVMSEVDRVCLGGKHHDPP